MRKVETTNSFTEGLVMDLNPLVVPTNTLSNALNATIITMNGNENVLQNDMGNGRVETAYLPEGYIPLGTAELGGIIYIVSYNPLIDKCQIGSFPSPERNLTSDEFQNVATSIKSEQFVNDSGDITNTVVRLELLDKQLSPGDKYIIYSPNNGVYENKELLSDYQSNDKLIGNNPKVITIHVVSIEDDGKIVYLDDTLKWYGDYYIKNYSGEQLGKDEAKTDIDGYRTLINSAYNTFRSKVSGKLALLFQLEVVDTFSVAWDAQITNITGDNYDKEATIFLYINYTSRHSNINISNIQIPSSSIGNIIKPPQSPDPVSGYYIYNIELPQGGRKNNGEDKSIKVEIGTIKYSSENLNNNVSFEIVPAMSFGRMQWLKQKISINLSNLGSGKIELDEWRYYKQENNILLNWGLLAYPEKNKSITKVTFDFVPFDKILKNDGTITYQEMITYNIPSRSSYSGNFQEIINLADYQDDNTLYSDYLYLVKINIDYSGEIIVKYRWLYTTGQWNNEFLKNEIEDFNELCLDDTIELDLVETVTDNIKVVEYQPDIKIPDSYTEQDTLIGAQITSVNYSEETKKFIDAPNISGNVAASYKNYSKLFNYSKQTGDTYTFNEPNLAITVGVNSTGTQGSLYTNSLPKINDQLSKSDIEKIIGKVLDEEVIDEKLDEKMADSFFVTLNSNVSGGFELDIKGSIFSRVVSSLKKYQTQPSQEIRPLIYKLSDFEEQGLEFAQWSGKEHVCFTDSYVAIGGNPTPNITFLIKNNQDTTYKSREYDNEKLSTTWDQLSPYIDELIAGLSKKSNQLFAQLLFGKYGEEATTYGLTSIAWKWGVLVKTNNENYFIPIQAFSDGTDGNQNSDGKTDAGSQNAERIARILMSLYTVHDGSTYTIDDIKVDQIYYVPYYTENLKITVNTSLNVTDSNTSTILISKGGGTASLKGLGETLSGSDISTNNIKFEASNHTYSKNIIINHQFDIYNTLYSKFNELIRYSINQIVRIPQEEGDKIIKLKSSRYDDTQAYVLHRDKIGQEDCLLPVSDSKSFNFIYYEGDIGKRENIQDGVSNDIVYLVSNENRKNLTHNLPLYNYLEVVQGQCMFNYTDILREKETISFYLAKKNREYIKVTNNSKLMLIG